MSPRFSVGCIEKLLTIVTKKPWQCIKVYKVTKIVAAAKTRYVLLERRIVNDKLHFKVAFIRPFYEKESYFFLLYLQYIIDYRYALIVCFTFFRQMGQVRL